MKAEMKNRLTKADLFAFGGVLAARISLEKLRKRAGASKRFHLAVAAQDAKRILDQAAYKEREIYKASHRT